MHNILFIETSPSGVTGGSFYSLLELIKILDKTKYRPFVLFYHLNHLLPYFSLAGAETFYLYDQVPEIKKNQKKSKKYFFKNAIWALLSNINSDLKNSLQMAIQLRKIKSFKDKAEEIIKNKMINLLYLNDGLTPGLPFIDLKQKYNIPVVIHERKIRNYCWIDKLYIKHVDYVICNSKFVKDNFSNYFTNVTKVNVIYNPVSSDLFVDEFKKEEIKKKLGIQNGFPVIAQISNILKGKGQDNLIKAIRIVKQYISIKVLLVGGTPPQETLYERELRSTIEKLNLKGEIIFCGFQADRANFIDIADLVVHVPSLPEPFGRVVVEAMQLKKPVITSKIGGTAELVDDGVNGLLVSPNNPEELAKAIVSLLSNQNRAKKMGEYGFKIAYERFSAQVFKEKIESVINNVLK